MNKYDVNLNKLISKEIIGKDIYDFKVEAPEIAEIAQAGQFAHIKVLGKTLRRPISICEINKKLGTVRFVFQVRGEGTKQLALTNVLEELDILAPLGKGFPLFKEKKALLIGGGIGVPPLLQIADFYKEKATAVFGFRDKESVILKKDFESKGSLVKIATDDGSFGHHGLVTDLIEDEIVDVIYACGPTPMLKAVKKFSIHNKIECYISLEERMACGIGACLGCAVKLIDEKKEEYFGHVCKDGPVFNCVDVVL